MDKCCGTCEYNRYDPTWEEYYCVNKDSENYGVETLPEESCEDWKYGS